MILAQLMEPIAKPDQNDDARIGNVGSVFMVLSNRAEAVRPVSWGHSAH